MLSTIAVRLMMTFRHLLTEKFRAECYQAPEPETQYLHLAPNALMARTVFSARVYMLNNGSLAVLISSRKCSPPRTGNLVTCL